MNQDQAYDLGYNMAAGKAAYENEQFMICAAIFIAIVIIVFAAMYIGLKIDEYKERKRREKKKKENSKKRIKKNDEIR